MSMAGNPHYDWYERIAEADADVDYTLFSGHATFALAYEQRTANLIGLYKLMRDEGNTQVPEYDELARDVAARLGMEEKDGAE